MYFLSLISILLSTSTATQSASVVDNVDAALARWEAIHQEDWQQVMACSKTIQDKASKGDVVVISRLMAIATNRSGPQLARYNALKVACELADSAGALVIVSAIKAMAITFKAQPGESREESLDKFIVEHNFSNHFFKTYAESLVDDLNDDERMLSLVVNSYKNGSIRGSSGIDVMLKCQVSQKVMDFHIVEMVKGTRKRLPESLLYRMSPAAMVQLRELVSTAQTPADLNYAAAGALAYLGDQKIKPILKAMLPAAHEHSKSAEAGLLKFIWRIEVQHPPEKLLTYIESIDKTGYRDRRTWAVKRAHKLGVPTESIRKAILAHAISGTTRVERVDIPQLKRLGLELGILSDGDAPIVEISVHRRIRVRH